MRRRIVYFIIPLIIGLAASLTGFSLLWRLFILSLMIPVVGYLWARFVLKDVQAEIMPMPSHSQAGQELQTQITLINRQKLPRLMLNVKEISDVPDYVNQTIVNLLPSREIPVTSKLSFSRRGRFHLGAYQISTSDPLGMFHTERFFGDSQEIVVYPETIDLPFFDPLHYMTSRYGPGRFISSDNSINVASIRDYVSGDSLKHVHWRTTAHSSHLMVKVYDPDRSQNSAKNIWVVCDMHEAVHTGRGLHSTEEYSISITASIIKKFIEQGWPVGYYAQAEKPYLFALDSGKEHLEHILSSMAAMQAIGKIPLEQLLTAEMGHFDLNSLTIVVTPAWNERLARTLLQIKKQQGVLVAILLDSGTFGEKTGMTVVPASLQANGIQVFTVKSGDNLSMSLDSRKF